MTTTLMNHAGGNGGKGDKIRVSGFSEDFPEKELEEYLCDIKKIISDVLESSNLFQFRSGVDKLVVFYIKQNPSNRDLENSFPDLFKLDLQTRKIDIETIKQIKDVFFRILLSKCGQRNPRIRTIIQKFSKSETDNLDQNNDEIINGIMEARDLFDQLSKKFELIARDRILLVSTVRDFIKNFSNPNVFDQERQRLTSELISVLLLQNQNLLTITLYNERQLKSYEGQINREYLQFIKSIIEDMYNKLDPQGRFDMEYVNLMNDFSSSLNTLEIEVI